MDKSQALYSFWAGFGIPAYDENTVPQDAPARYITYNTATASIETVVNLRAKIWDVGTNSWRFVEEKAGEIAEHIAKMDPPTIQLNNGRLNIAEGSPFAQRYDDGTKDARCVLINIQAEYLTAF